MGDLIKEVEKLDTLSKEYLCLIADVEDIMDVPRAVLERCVRVDMFIKRVKPYGGLKSTQTMALIYEQWAREE